MSSGPDAIVLARSFGEGADARLAGHRPEDNPYRPLTPCWKSWRQGWEDVDGFWARWVQGRWLVRALPEAREVGSV